MVAHGSTYELPPLFKVTALRQLMIGRAKDNFESWMGDEDSDTESGFNNILNKVRDFARRRKLDTDAAKGSSNMAVDEVGESAKVGQTQHHHGEGCGGERQHHGETPCSVDAVRGKGKGKGFMGPATTVASSATPRGIAQRSR